MNNPMNTVKSAPLRIASRRLDELGTGGRLTTFPTGIAAVDDAAALYARERDVAEAVARELSELVEANRARDEAERLDAEAYAAARRSGAKDPGPVHLSAFHAKVQDLTRRRAGLKISVETAGREYLAALRAHETELVTDAVERLGRANDRIRAAVAELDAAVSGRLEAGRFASWVQHGPTEPLGRAKPHVVVNGERLRVSAALAGFVEIADAETGFEPVVGNRFYDPGDPASLPALAVPGVPIPARLRRGRGSDDGPVPAA